MRLKEEEVNAVAHALAKADGWVVSKSVDFTEETFGRGAHYAEMARAAIRALDEAREDK